MRNLLEGDHRAGINVTQSSPSVRKHPGTGFSAPEFNKYPDGLTLNPTGNSLLLHHADGTSSHTSDPVRPVDLDAAIVDYQLILKGARVPKDDIERQVERSLANSASEAANRFMNHVAGLAREQLSKVKRHTGGEVPVIVIERGRTPSQLISVEEITVFEEDHNVNFF